MVAAVSAGSRLRGQRVKQRVLFLLLLGLLDVACGPSASPALATDMLATDMREKEEAVHSVCPPGETLLGVDVSKYETTIDWPSVAGAGMKFAFIRVSDGLSNYDPYFDT